jgi:hypothetical protein
MEMSMPAIHKCFETERMCMYNTTLTLHLIMIVTTHLYKTTRNESGCHVGPVTATVTSQKPGESLIAYASLTFVFPFHNLFMQKQKQKHQRERKREKRPVPSSCVTIARLFVCLSNECGFCGVLSLIVRDKFKFDVSLFTSFGLGISGTCN